MKQTLSWDDLRLFLSVARAGGLAGAASATGISPATLSRRVAALERALGARLVERGARGYELTESGHELVRQAQDMEQAAQLIGRWSQGKSAIRRVRISAGDWTMRLLIDHIDEFWGPDASWCPEFLSDMRDRDIARRQIDIGIRNRRPVQEWLAGQKVGTVQFAVFKSKRDLSSGQHVWVELVEDDANTPTGLWLRERGHEGPTVTVNKANLALSLVRQGKARMVLPIFAGAAFPDLVQIGDPIEELQTERWIVTHHEERHEPAVRAASRGILKLLRSNPILKP
ncbi:LysR family transcriptional regulator [Roseibium denhamense]|nr:LysR family transcriptional regulator [Roseibium denhamense]MTI05882.1 LysR family transcriptional regulator [Roseibium denhamense]